jgi:hypothetical protein
MKSEYKICRDCAHLIGVRHNSSNSGDWSCGHEKNLDPEIDLVTGKKNKLIENIQDVRYNHCKGEWYEEYIYTSASSSTKIIKSLADDL